MTNARPIIKSETLARTFFLGALLVLLYQLALLLTPFLSSLMGAAALALAFQPVHRAAAGRLRLQPTPAAALSTFCVLAAIVLPLVLLGWLVVREGPQLAPAAQRVMERARAVRPTGAVDRLPAPLRASVRDLARRAEDLQDGDWLERNAHRLGTGITSYGTRAARNALFFLINLALLGVALFYAFRDGESLLRWGVRLVPMPQSHKQKVLDRVYQTFQAIVVGALATAFVQGVVATGGYLIAGLKLPWLLGAATTFAALLSASFLVTLPVGLYALSQDTFWGVFLLAWGVGLVGGLDNFLKPVLIGSKARLPILLLFLAMVGAVRVYGFFGVILGPLLVTAVLSFAQIYREEFFHLREEGP